MEICRKEYTVKDLMGMMPEGQCLREHLFDLAWESMEWTKQDHYGDARYELTFEWHTERTFVLGQGDCDVVVIVIKASL
jgi:hypothetical protein